MPMSYRLREATLPVLPVGHPSIRVLHFSASLSPSPLLLLAPPPQNRSSSERDDDPTTHPQKKKKKNADRRQRHRPGAQGGGEGVGAAHGLGARRGRAGKGQAGVPASGLRRGGERTRTRMREGDEGLEGRGRVF